MCSKMKSSPARPTLKLKKFNIYFFILIIFDLFSFTLLFALLFLFDEDLRVKADKETHFKSLFSLEFLKEYMNSDPSKVQFLFDDVKD